MRALSPVFALFILSLNLVLARAAEAAPSKAQLMAYIISRCGTDRTCINKEVDGMNKVMSVPKGSPKEAWAFKCLSAFDSLEKVDWSLASRCVDEFKPAK